MSTPLVSIVTATLNVGKTLEETLRSAFEQTFTNFEYIIKDGQSTDNTKDIIARYADKIAYAESTPDKSLYDAMNIGTAHATGEWVYYLQGDDRFYSPTTLEQIAPYLERTNADVVYGDATILFDWNVKELFKGKPIETIWWRQPFSHQATFVRTSLMKQYPFDLTYRLSADYNCLYQLYHLGYTFEYAPIMVGLNNGGGRSDKNRIKGLKEVLEIKKKYDHNPMHHLMFQAYIAKSDFNLKLRALLPEKMVQAIFKIREKLRYSSREKK